MAPGITPQQAREFYDRFGSKQDSQSFYEDRALDLMVARADFRSATRVFELGCGTGRLAERLLDRELPPDATYHGVDVSQTMVDLTTARVARFGARAKVARTDGGERLDLPDASVDRLVACYVFDLMDEAVIQALLREAHRALEPGGLLAAVCLTRGERGASRWVSGAWSRVQRLMPVTVGGCRPIVLADHLEPGTWKVRFHEVVTAWGVPSEVLIAAH